MATLGSVHLVIKREKKISRGSFSTPNFSLKMPAFSHGCYRKLRLFHEVIRLN